MTEVATDYTAASMILGMFDWYLQNLYWELRMCVFLIVGMIAVGFLEFAAACVRDSYAGKDTIKKALRILEWAVSAVLAVIMVFWLYRQGFCACLLYTSSRSRIWRNSPPRLPERPQS